MGGNPNGNPNIIVVGKKTQFKKGVSGNPKGQPRKGISLINKQLEDKGHIPATKADIETNYMHLINLEEQELKDLVNDKTQPMMIRVIVKNMLSGKGFDIIEKMLDRGIGKAIQKGEIAVSGSISLVGLHNKTKKIEE